MQRQLILGTLVVVGLSIAIAAQAPPAPSAAALSATKIEKVTDTLYVITGSAAENQATFSGGNTAVFITDKGVVLVDTKNPGWGPTILARIKTVTDKPVTTLINTHTHGDHTGSNEFFGVTVDSVVQQNARASMARMPEFSGDKAKFLPKRTYTDKLTIGSGKDQIDLYHFGPGHTNGDTFVVFPSIRTMHAGDMFAWRALPFIDPANGGTAVGHAQTLAKVVAGVKGVDTVIGGHIPPTTWASFSEYASFSNDFVEYARGAVKAKKTVDQAATEYTVPAKYKGYVVSVNPAFGSAKANLELAYKEVGR